MASSRAWQSAPEGYSPLVAVCFAHPSRVLVRRGAAQVFGDGFMDIVWEARDGESRPGGELSYADGGRKHTLRCPRCGVSAERRQEHLAAILKAQAQAGRFDRRGRLVLDITLVA